MAREWPGTTLPLDRAEAHSIGIFLVLWAS
jgi:hypothetical protein